MTESSIQNLKYLFRFTIDLRFEKVSEDIHEETFYVHRLFSEKMLTPYDYCMRMHTR